MIDNVQLLRFDGIWVVSEVEEVPDVEFGDPDCVLRYPYQVEGSCLGPFPLHAREREFVVRSSDISLVCDPTDFIYKEYCKLVESEKE